MKTIYIKYICAICAICGLTACSDFLEEQKPQATLIQDEIKNPQYIDNVLITAYAGLVTIEDNCHLRLAFQLHLGQVLPVSVTRLAVHRHAGRG